MTSVRNPISPDVRDGDLGSEQPRISGICPNPVLDQASRTLGCRLRVTLHDGNWSYEEPGMLQIPGRDGPAHHNTLTRVRPPTPNPFRYMGGNVQ
jgi:hypothetical protein